MQLVIEQSGEDRLAQFDDVEMVDPSGEVTLDHDNQARVAPTPTMPASPFPVLFYHSDGRGYGSDGENPLIQSAHPDEPDVQHFEPMMYLNEIDPQDDPSGEAVDSAADRVRPNSKRVHGAQRKSSEWDAPVAEAWAHCLLSFV